MASRRREFEQNFQTQRPLILSHCNLFGIWLQFPQICDEKRNEKRVKLQTKIQKFKQKIISVENRYKYCIRKLASKRRNSFMAASNWHLCFTCVVSHSSPATQSIKEDIYSLFCERRSYLTGQINSTSLFGVVVCCYLCRGLRCEVARKGKLQDVQTGE